MRNKIIKKLFFSGLKVEFSKLLMSDQNLILEVKKLNIDSLFNFCIPHKNLYDLEKDVSHTEGCDIQGSKEKKHIGIRFKYFLLHIHGKEISKKIHQNGWWLFQVILYSLHPLVFSEY